MLQVLVLRTCSSGSFASVVNTHTGKEVTRLDVPDGVTQVSRQQSTQRRPAT